MEAEMITIQLKPLSVNKAYTGRRHNTPAKRAFTKAALFMLPKLKEPLPDKIKLTIVWGFTSKASDWDNPVKVFQDVLQAKYGFNDARVWQGVVTKTISDKPFISFKIEPYVK